MIAGALLIFQIIIVVIVVTSMGNLLLHEMKPSERNFGLQEKGLLALSEELHPTR